MRSRPSSVPHSVRSLIRVRSMIDAGRPWSRLSSTMTSVPPALGVVSGWAAFMSSASAQVEAEGTPSLPGQAGVGSVFSRHRALDLAVRAVGRVEDLVGVLQAERREVDHEV